MQLLKVENSNVYKKVMEEADVISGSALVVSRLLAKASWRLRWITPSLVFYITFKDDMSTIIRMLRAYYDGRYREVSRSTLLKLLAAVIYFLSPIHLAIDLIPVIGLLDDAIIIGWVVRSVKKDVEAFKQWEALNPTVTYA